MLLFLNPKCSECVFLPICFGGYKSYRANFISSSYTFNEASAKAYIEDIFFRIEL